MLVVSYRLMMRITAEVRRLMSLKIEKGCLSRCRHLSGEVSASTASKTRPKTDVIDMMREAVDLEGRDALDQGHEDGNERHDGKRI